MVYGSKIKEPFRDDLALAIGPIIKTPLFLNEQAVPELIQVVLGDSCGQRFLKTLRRMYRNCLAPHLNTNEKQQFSLLSGKNTTNRKFPFHGYESFKKKIIF